MYTVLPDGTAAIIYLKALDVRPEVISFRCRWKVETLIATRKERGSGEKNEKWDKIELLRGDEREREREGGGRKRKRAREHKSTEEE